MQDQPTENGLHPIKISFSQGLIGLENYRRFELQNIPEQEMFFLLRSLDDENFGLVVTSPFWFKQDYEFELPDQYLKQLGDPNHMQIFVTVNLNPDPKDITANLLGPIVINHLTKIGFQLVLDKGYSAKHKILSEPSAGGK